MNLPIDPKSLHHAYFLVGNKDTVWFEVMSFVESDLGFSTHGNPDFYGGQFDTFTIDDARNLTEQHIRKPFVGDRKIFIVYANSMTVEAQNALLKLFEEPILGNHFFLIMPEEKGIIPTLRSRLSFVSFAEETQSENKLGKEFLKAVLSDRLKLVAEIAEDKDKERAKELVRLLTDVLHSAALIENSPVLKDLMKAEDYLSDRSPSIKMILEHIAVSLPRIA